MNSLETRATIDFRAEHPFQRRGICEVCGHGPKLIGRRARGKRWECVECSSVPARGAR